MGFSHFSCPYCGAEIHYALFENKCVIATEIFGPESYEVMRLRQWRNQDLYGHAVGRGAVAAYYRISPALIPILRRHGFLRMCLRFAISQWVNKLGNA